MKTGQRQIKVLMKKLKSEARVGEWFGGGGSGVILLVCILGRRPSAKLTSGMKTETSGTVTKWQKIQVSGS